MSMAVGDIIKVTDFQSFLGQVVDNVYFYRITAIPVAFSGLTVDESVCRAFHTAIVLFVLNLQNDQLQHNSIRMDNVTNGIDFAEIPATDVGLLSGDPSASFAALNFILRRSTAITRNGSKRVGGIDETLVSGNSYVGAPTAVSNFAVQLATPLKDGTLPTPVDFAEPVIVGRRQYTTSSGGIAYELDLTKINPVASAALTAVSTQRSRKAGHGV